MGNPESPSKQGSGQGYFIKKKVAFLLAAGVLVSLVGVALITYFVGVDGNSSGKGGGSGGEEPTNPTDPSKPSKLTDIRLPSHLKPLSYDVRLVPFLVEGNFTIDGSIKITLDCLKGGSRNITLHSYDIDVDAGSLVVKEKAGRSDDGLGIADTRYDKEREFFIIELSESLEEGKTYEVAMEFKGILGDNLKGFYRSSFTNEDDKKEYIAVTQFQPTDARRAFPCFDEPALKAKFRITLGRLPGQTAISNMPLQETKVDTGRYSGYEFDTFEESEPMSTYLVAMVICSFEFKESLTDNEAKTKFRIWARDSVIDQTAFAKEVGPKILKHFEDFFGVKYPLPKQDMIAIPDFAAGAMENWGLITYREIALLFKEGVSSVLSKQKIATVISHELAHQWFGNLVTPKWWTDLWLNEGFASFVEYLGVENAVPEFHLQEQFVYMDLQHVFGIDALESSHPISIPVGHPSEINEIFDKISYSKGASIIRMMDSFLTRDTLKKGLKNYLTDNQFDAAEQDDLWEHLTAQAHKDGTLSKDKSVKEIMDTWTLQMGFPVVTIKRDYELGKIELNQERFLLSESGKSNDTHDYQWVIPLTFAQPGGDFGNTKNNAWLGDKKLELDVKDADKTKPMIFNVQQTGYFRVNYDEKTWDLIIKSISSDPSSVHVLNRAQILDDSLNLARAGRLSYEIALNTLSNLEVEAAYVPWSSALTGISFLNQMLQRTPAYGNFKKYVEKLVSKRYEELQFDPIDGESHLDKLLRVKIIGWACKMGNPECLSKVQEKFQAWRDSNDTDANNPINVDIRSKVYCNAIAEGGEDEWDFLWDRYLKSDVPSDKLTMLSALSCTKKIWLLNRFLERSVNASSGIRKQDGSGVISSIAQRTIGRDLAFDFVRDNWEKIASYYGRAAFSFSGIIRAVMANRNTRFELKELEDFHEDHKNEFSSATRTAEQAIENAKNNIAWMDSSYETIQSVLEGKITDDA